MRDDVKAAIAALQRGDLIGLPTETVYGLGADAMNPDAVRKIFRVKGRPAGHPLIVHIAGSGQLDKFARDLPVAVEKLAARFWPGPLTLVLKRNPSVPDAVTGGRDTVALRVPDHPLALELLRAFDSGVAAPSANRFGRISATRPEHVRAELGDEVAIVLDGGPCRVGVESTILALTGARPLLLRPGAVTSHALAEVLGEEPRIPSLTDDAPPAPGTLASHYAPRTKLELCAAEALSRRCATLLKAGLRLAVLARRDPPQSLAGDRAYTIWQRAPDDAAPYAHELYARLRELDDAGCDRIVVENVPEGSAWVAIADRLQRAAFSGV